MNHPDKAFYENWARGAGNKPDRGIILKWKAMNLANLYLRTKKSESIQSICEIGGAEGIILHNLGTIFNASQLVNYELSSEFCQMGQERYPDIQFINTEFAVPEQKIYDLIVLSDIIEHIDDEAGFLNQVSKSCKYALIKIPIEECLTNQGWFYRIRGKKKPIEICYGPQHLNGHLRGYTIRKAKIGVARYFHILDREISDVTYFYGSRKQALLKRWLGTQIIVWLFGGALFLLGRSKNNTANV